MAAAFSPFAGLPSKQRQLRQAAATGNLSLLKRLATELNDGKGMAETIASAKDYEGQSAIHAAAATGNLEICNYLIQDLKIDVDTKDARGDTPLLHAARGGHFNTAEYLLKKGAHASISGEHGLTPLHFAAQIGHNELLHLLLSKGVNVDAVSSMGTALQSAVGKGDQEAVKILLSHHADPNFSFSPAITCLSMAIKAGSSQCVKLLLEAGADPNTSIFGVTPIVMAASLRETEMIRYLLKSKADPNVTNEEGHTPVEITALTSNHQGFEILFPVTSRITKYSDWSFEGIVRHATSLETRAQLMLRKKEYFEATKLKANVAFREKDYFTSIYWYSKAIAADPSDGVLLSNRSLCYARLEAGHLALQDAEACIALKPDWPKAYYRAGAAWNLLENFEGAAKAFSTGLKLDPQNKELQKAYWEAVETFANWKNANGYI